MLVKHIESTLPDCVSTFVNICFLLISSRLQRLKPVPAREQHPRKRSDSEQPPSALDSPVGPLGRGRVTGNEYSLRNDLLSVC